MISSRGLDSERAKLQNEYPRSIQEMYCTGATVEVVIKLDGTKSVKKN